MRSGIDLFIAHSEFSGSLSGMPLSGLNRFDLALSRNVLNSHLLSLSVEIRQCLVVGCQLCFFPMRMDDLRW